MAGGGGAADAITRMFALAGGSGATAPITGDAGSGRAPAAVPVPITRGNCDIERKEGTSVISIPEGMSLDEAMEWLKRRKADEEQEVAFDEYFPVDPWDGAVLCMQAMAHIFGFVAQAPKMTFFGPQPPAMLTVDLSPTESMKVPWGDFKIPGVEGTVTTQAHPKRRGEAPVFNLEGTVKKKSLPIVQKLIDEINRRIRAGISIYRGKAVDTAKKFIELKDVGPANLIVPKDVQAALISNLFTPICATARCRDSSIPLKRGILLTGPYGVGKSLTAQVTAALCAKNNWTFVLVKDLSHFEAALTFAKHYQPAVVFAEDVDQLFGGPRDGKLNGLLEQIDGVLAKGTEVMVVMTTNFIENINPAMLRPGRLDAIISFTKPDADAAERLLRRYTEGQCCDDVDYKTVGERCAGMIPAVIAEVGSRAKLTAIARDPGAAELRLTTEDLLVAATQLQAHQKLVEAEKVDPLKRVEDAAKVLRPILYGVVPGQNVQHECGKCQHVEVLPLSSSMKCSKCGWFSTTGTA